MRTRKKGADRKAPHVRESNLKNNIEMAIDNIITVVFSEQDIEKMNNAIALLNEVISHKI